MKFGMRTPSLKKSIKARTTGKAKRAVKKALIPGYGKKVRDGLRILRKQHITRSIEKQVSASWTYSNKNYKTNMVKIAGVNQ